MSFDTLNGRGKPVKDDKAGRPGTMQTELTQRKPRGRLGRDVQNKIGQQLRAMYDNVVGEGVPDRFSSMLERLDQDRELEQRGLDEKDEEKGSG
jgi:hypothetical protein